MGKEKEISRAEECTHGRREGGGTPAVGGGGGKQQDLGTKGTSSRAFIKRWGWGFSPDETEEKCTQKKSLVVLFPAYLILPGNLKS